MGLDLFLQRFQDGDAATADAPGLWALIEAASSGSQPDRNYVRVQVGPAGADVYAEPVGHGPVGSLMVSRPETGTEGLILEMAQLAGLAILVPDGPTVITDEQQREHLPVELRGDAVVATTAEELATAIQG